MVLTNGQRPGGDPCRIAWVVGILSLSRPSFWCITSVPSAPTGYHSLVMGRSKEPCTVYSVRSHRWSARSYLSHEARETFAKHHYLISHRYNIHQRAALEEYCVIWLAFWLSDGCFKGTLAGDFLASDFLWIYCRLWGQNDFDLFVFSQIQHSIVQCFTWALSETSLMST